MKTHIIKEHMKRGNGKDLVDDATPIQSHMGGLGEALSTLPEPLSRAVPIPQLQWGQLITAHGWPSPKTCSHLRTASLPGRFCSLPLRVPAAPVLGMFSLDIAIFSVLFNVFLALIINFQC